jgi:hypothetical protein
VAQQNGEGGCLHFLWSGGFFDEKSPKISVKQASISADIPHFFRKNLKLFSSKTNGISAQRAGAAHGRQQGGKGTAGAGGKARRTRGTSCREKAFHKGRLRDRGHIGG